MNISKTIISAALLLINFLPINPASAADDSDFWIGILRKDGLLTPVAYYNNDSWTTPWPNELSDKQLDASIKSVFGEKPKKSYTAPVSQIPREWLGAAKLVPVKWYLYDSNNKPSPISATQVKLHESHCSPMWSMVTNYSEKEFVDYWPKPKAGFIASQPISMNLMQDVKANSVISHELKTILEPRFRKLERDHIAKEAKKSRSTDRLKYTGHPVSEVEREKVDVEIKNIYKTTTPISGENLYYVNLVKEYDKPRIHPDFECKAKSWFSAWVSKKGQNSKVLSEDIGLSDCNMKGIDTKIPNTMIPLAGKYYLISENYGYEWEYYTIDLLDNGQFKRIVTVGGGGC